MTHPIQRIVFWEPSVSPHKAPLFRAIKKYRPDIDFLHIAQSDISPERKAMGWTSPIPRDYTQIIGPDLVACKAAVLERVQETLHVFSGMRHVPCIVDGLRLVQDAGARFAIMSEPRVNEGLHGCLRYLQSLLTEHYIRKNAVCVFAIGRNGPAWFKSVGYAAAKIFPFAYFIDTLTSDIIDLEEEIPKLKIGYLGRLIRAKGLFNLLAAFSTFGFDEAILKLAGPISEEIESIEFEIKKCAGKVELLGSIPMTEVASYLSCIDILVLPSITKDDGWGVVVTEALMMGIPVVATTCVGASLVLVDERLGVVVEPNEPLKIADAIRRISVSENLLKSKKYWRSKWAEQHLSADAGAQYFWSVLDHRLNGTLRPAPFYK